MKKRGYFLAFTILLSVAGLKAQDFASAFQQVNATYAKTPNISMQVQYSLFTNYVSTVPFENSIGFFVKEKGNYYSKLLGITTIQNSRYKLSVNENEKVIIVSNPAESEKAPSLPMIDSMLVRCSSKEVVDLDNGTKRYILHFEKTVFSEFDRIDIEINAAHFVSKLVLFYREAVNLDESNTELKKEKPRLEISYSSINTQPVISQEQFSEKHYINVNGKQIVLNSSFSNYRLLNHKI